jgi:hypothetical protein
MQVLTGRAVGVGTGLFSIAQVIWAKEARIYYDFQQLPGLGIPVIRTSRPNPGGSPASCSGSQRRPAVALARSSATAVPIA